MDSELQTLALVAAMSNKQLRKLLDVADFDAVNIPVVTALKDGKSKDARTVIQSWLSRFGVKLDGQTQDIGEAILSSLQERNRIRHARTQLKLIEQRLRWPHLAGPKAVAESMETLKAIEDQLNAKLQQHNSGGTPDA